MSRPTPAELEARIDQADDDLGEYVWALARRFDLDDVDLKDLLERQIQYLLHPVKVGPDFFEDSEGAA